MPFYLKTVCCIALSIFSFLSFVYGADLQVTAKSKGTTQSNSCSDPKFINEYLTRSEFKGGHSMAAAVGLMALTDTTAYKNLSAQAKNDIVSAKFKEFIDDLQAESEKVRTKAAVSAAIIEEQKAVFKKKYGNGFPTDKADAFGKSPQREEFRNAIDAKWKEHGVGYFYDDVHKMEADLEKRWVNGKQPFLQSYIKDLIGRQARLLGYESMHKYGRSVSTYVDIEYEKFQNDVQKRMAAKERKNIKGALSAHVNSFNFTKQGVPGNMRIDEGNFGKRAVVGGAALGIAGVVGAQTMAPAQAASALKKCQGKLGLSDSEVTSLIDNVEMRKLPGVFESPPSCDDIRIAPTRVGELASADGEFSPGHCKLLEKDLGQWRQEQEKPFALSVKSCDSADLTVGGESVGQFKVVDSSHYDFEIPGSDVNHFGAKFPVQYNGGIDFDPQAIECFQKTTGGNIRRPSCSSKIKDALMDGASGSLTPSLTMSRAKLLNSKDVCRVNKGDSMYEPLCRFSDNSQQIQQASALYSMKCSSFGSSGAATSGDGKSRNTDAVR